MSAVRVRKLGHTSRDTNGERGLRGTHSWVLPNGTINVVHADRNAARRRVERFVLLIDVRRQLVPNHIPGVDEGPWREDAALDDVDAGLAEQTAERDAVDRSWREIPEAHRSVGAAAPIQAEPARNDADRIVLRIVKRRRDRCR